MAEVFIILSSSSLILADLGVFDNSSGSLGMGVVGAIYRGGKAGTIRKKLS
jgi:hypothetical protein